jgi:hypothetical protein
MMGLITFLLADFMVALVAKDRKKVKQLFITILSIGLCAMFGFIVAICMHAQLRGNGDIMAGVVTIFNHDVLRRTAGADLNFFGSNLWDSINASVWEVLCMYFHFDTEILTAIPGKLFQVGCLIPLGIFSYDYNKKALNIQEIALYTITLVSSISWIVLAKSHSYIHTHLNYVLWYFGFIQICIYIIIKKIVYFSKNRDWRANK